ncbi:hypothetical protein [Streptomyces sp. NPDC001155]
MLHLTSETPRSRPSPPYDPAAITAAIRYYAVALQDLLTEHGMQAHLDNSPLLALLDAVDHQALDASTHGTQGTN